MVMLEVYSKPVREKYKAFLLSKASLITLSCEILTITLPFVICYHTGGFWLKRDVVYEQPDVKFQGHYLFWATTNVNSKTITCSSYPWYNKYVGTLDTCSSIKVRQWDQNYDNKMDLLEFSIKVRLPPKLYVKSYHFVLPLNYNLKLPCVFQTDSALIYQQQPLTRVGQVTLHGDLGLHQSEPLKCSNLGRATNLNSPLITDKNDTESYSLEQIIENYAASKVKTTLKNDLYVPNPANEEEAFTFNLKLSIPEEKIYFKPKIWQILKIAWLQFLALYIVTSWVIFEIKGYIFRNNLVLLYKDKTNLNK